MGTNRAPKYVNILMGAFEKLHNYSQLKNFSKFYCRFIDDMFFLWNGTESELIKSIYNLNKKTSYNEV